MDGSIIPSRMNDVLQKSADHYEPRGRLDPAGFERHVSFRTYLPPDDLAPFIEHFWTIRWDEDDNTYYSEEVMHRPTWMSLFPYSNSEFRVPFAAN